MSTLAVQQSIQHLLSRGSEVGVVGSGRILDGHQHSVAGSSSFTPVVLLEVEGGLGEPISVRDVVNGVHDVESVSPCSVDVGCGGWGTGGGVWIVENETSAGLCSHRAGGRLVRNDVVAAESHNDIELSEVESRRGDSRSSGGVRGTISAVPSVRRSSVILRVHEGLLTFRKDLLSDRKYGVLWTFKLVIIAVEEALSNSQMPRRRSRRRKGFRQSEHRRKPRTR